MMKLIIDIPEKEFGINIDGKFKDFFYRLKAEIKAHLINNTSLVCGAYELETIDMFLDAFNNATPLPEHHGRLIDADWVKNTLDIYVINEYNGQFIRRSDIDTIPTIIEGSDSDANSD